MQNDNKRTMAAPPEVLFNRTLRAQFIRKYGRIPVAPNHWSLQEGTADRLPRNGSLLTSPRRTVLHMQTVVAHVPIVFLLAT